MKTESYVVLVGMDFSELADRALRQAFDLASRRDSAEVHVISMIPAANVDPNYGIPGYALNNEAGSLDAACERLRAHVQSELDAFGARGGKVPGRVVSHVRIDTPMLGLVQLASDLKADLIVVGTHGRHGISRLLMGSVAEATVRHAPCPVLVVPPSFEPAAEAKIEPACPKCLTARRDSAGQELWCEQHRERHGRRHTYHQSDSSSRDSNFPLVFR